MSAESKYLLVHGDDGSVYKIGHDDLQQYRVPESDPSHAVHKEQLDRKRKGDEDVCIFGLVLSS